MERALGLAVIGVAVGVAALSDAPAPAASLAPEQQRAAYQALAGAESAMRDQGYLAFPGDPWSQDDHFHSIERGAALEYATAHRVTLQSVLAAVDTGLREGWSLPDGGAAPRATVPVCRPRPVD